jgi:hypothetical protein
LHYSETDRLSKQVYGGGEALWILVISKIHAQSYDAVGISKDSTKALAKTKNCLLKSGSIYLGPEVL